MNKHDIYTILKQIRDGKKDNELIQKENKLYLKRVGLANLEKIEDTEAEEIKEAFIEFLIAINVL